MAQQAKVPEFGNWDSGDNVPYTQYFEKALKDRIAGKVKDPNGPQENPEAFHASSDAPAFGSTPDSETAKPKDVIRTSRDDDAHLTESPLRYDLASRKITTDSPHHKHGYRPNPGDQHRRASRAGGGSDNSIEQSPLHPNYQGKPVNKGISSPSKSSTESGNTLSSSTASRLRMKAGGRGEEKPERGSAVPKFGEWDESNPSSADGYTNIFNKVKEEKQSGSGKVAIFSEDTIYIPSQDSNNMNSGCGCFNWLRK